MAIAVFKCPGRRGRLGGPSCELLWGAAVLGVFVLLLALLQATSTGTQIGWFIGRCCSELAQALLHNGSPLAQAFVLCFSKQKPATLNNWYKSETNNQSFPSWTV